MQPPHRVLDFRKETDYLKTLPQLVAAVLGIEQHPQYKYLFSDYSMQVRALEAMITLPAVVKRLETAEQELLDEVARWENQRNSLLKNIPEELRKELEGVQDIQVKAFHAQLATIRNSALHNRTNNSLSQYIPLKGAHSPNPPPNMIFDIFERCDSNLICLSFMSNTNDFLKG